MASVYRSKIRTFHRGITSVLTVHFLSDDVSTAGPWEVANELYHYMLLPGGWYTWFCNMLPFQTDVVAQWIQRIFPTPGPRFHPNVHALGLDGVWMNIVQVPSDHLRVKWFGSIEGFPIGWSDIGPLDRSQFNDGRVDPIFLPIAREWATIHKGPGIGALGDSFRGCVVSSVAPPSAISNFEVAGIIGRSRLRRKIV